MWVGGGGELINEEAHAEFKLFPAQPLEEALL